jgi:hypothetical protein
MLDLETLGKRPGCVVRSVGAVVFDPRGGPALAEFYRNVNLASCLEAGLKIDAETLLWWEEQAPEARASLRRPSPDDVLTVLSEFHAWFRSYGGVWVWSHGANFDEPIWGCVAAALGYGVPWKFWDVRCTRTLYHIKNFDPKSVPREGVYHNALDDAWHQAVCVQRAWAL